MNYHYFTSESVCKGHPDKICDQVSDAVLDEAYKRDSYSRVAVECLATKNRFVMAGEVTTRAKLNFEKIARKVIKDLGYTKKEFNFHHQKTPIDVFVHKQSPDIAQGVDAGGAGDQGCIKKGTLVKTDKGFLPIEKIKKDDLVVTPYGLKKVLETKKTGVKDIIELHFINGMRLECTPDHRIFCYRKDGRVYWRQAAKLTSKDFICILKPSGFSSSDYFVSRVSRKKFFTKYNHKIIGPEKVVLDEEIGYIIGLLIGDGYIGQRKSMNISFGKNKKFALKIKKILDKKFPGQWRMIENKKGLIDLKIDSILVRKHFERFGVSYTTASYKTTPQAIFTSPASVIKAYLRGLFDSDGTIIINTGRKKKNIRIRLSSSSYRLVQETQLLLAEFEIRSSILLNASKGKPVGRDRRYKSRYDNFVISLTGFTSYQNFGKEIGFFHPDKLVKMKNYLATIKKRPINSPGIYLVPHPCKEEMISEQRINKELPFTITTLKKKIKKSKADVYDLEVAEKNMFSANGIYVHNSMFGYACKETKELMPAPIMISHRLVQRIDEIREKRIIPYLRPDGKSEVKVRYEKGKPVAVEQVVLAVPHEPEIENKQIKRDLYKWVVVPVLEEFKFKLKSKDLVVNGTGRWLVGGPGSDTGETGRKIMVDTYGGMGRHGGGCFSGKDPTKVDRSGAYACRFLAKNIVAAGLAERVEVKVAYVIGQAKPIDNGIETFGTEKKPLKVIKDFAFKLLDLSVPSILEKLDLRRPIYLKTACYGHFGRDTFPWEKIVV